jgi:hypothetical protein
MSAERWESFVENVQRAVFIEGGTVYATAYGRGEWDGIVEDNAVVTFADVEDVVALRARLSALAVAFNQDAIALLAGTSELVGAEVAA